MSCMYVMYVCHVCMHVRVCYHNVLTYTNDNDTYLYIDLSRFIGELSDILQTFAPGVGIAIDVVIQVSTYLHAYIHNNTVNI